RDRVIPRRRPAARRAHRLPARDHPRRLVVARRPRRPVRVPHEPVEDLLRLEDRHVTVGTIIGRHREPAILAEPEFPRKSPFLEPLAIVHVYLRGVPLPVRIGTAVRWTRRGL